MNKLSQTVHTYTRVDKHTFAHFICALQRQLCTSCLETAGEQCSLVTTTQTVFCCVCSKHSLHAGLQREGSVCVCLCVCIRERGARERESNPLSLNFYPHTGRGQVRYIRGPKEVLLNQILLSSITYAAPKQTECIHYLNLLGSEQQDAVWLSQRPDADISHS